MWTVCFIFAVISFFAHQFEATVPVPGKWHVVISKNESTAVFAKYLFNNTDIIVKAELACDTAGVNSNEYLVEIHWMLRYTKCSEIYFGSNDEFKLGLLIKDGNIPFIEKEQIVEYQVSAGVNRINCDDRTIILENESLKGYNVFKIPTNATTSPPPPVVANRRREADEPVQTDPKYISVTGKISKETKDTPETTELPIPIVSTTTVSSGLNVVTKCWRDGAYLFIVSVKAAKVLESFDVLFRMRTSDTSLTARYTAYALTPAEGMNNNQSMTFNLTLDVEMKGPSGYISADEWPFIPFYATMCVVYILLGIAWFVMCAMEWKDLLRVQFWISGVILLGMIEKAVFEAEYQRINVDGSLKHLPIFLAELISVSKRTFARMLMIVVSTGFGIVKPRLGPMLHRVLALGGLYFTVAAVEAVLRTVYPKEDNSKVYFANIPLCIVETMICWSIFSNLVSTIRTLRLRRNMVKLALYRHIMYTLIFCVLAAVAFMVWDIYNHKFTTCLTGWKQLWINDAYWHVLFFCMLVIIVILLRPNVNNQRFAFTPLTDAAANDSDCEEPFLGGDAFDSVKMRQVANGKTKKIVQTGEEEEEDALRWVEENIPSTVADLPAMLDSDEEIVTTKYELSKMH